MNSSYTTSKELRLVFAIGGKSLTMPEIQTVAHALADYLPRYASNNASNLQDDLVRMMTDKLIDHQGSDFTYLADDLLDCAIDFFSTPGSAAAADAVSKALPFIMPDGAANYERLARDVHNTLLAKDMKAHQRSLENLQKHFPQDYAFATPYQFIIPLLDTPWFQNLPTEFLSFCARHLIPSMIVNLKPLDPILDFMLPRHDTLLGFAIYAMTDALILQGRLEEAENLLKNDHHDAVMTRKAWLHFLHGNLQEATAVFSNMLDTIRRSSYQTDYYFSAITGIIYILALIRQKSSNSISNALAYTKLALGNPLWGGVYEHLHDFLMTLTYGESRTFRTMATEPRNNFTKFFAFILDYWRDPLLFANTQLAAVQSFRNQAAQNNYGLVVAECDELIARLDSAWIPNTPSSVAFWADHHCESILLCHDVLPTWTIELNKLRHRIDEESQKRGTRLAWLVEPAPPPVCMSLRPIEQQLTKTGKWTKGHAVNLDKLLLDVKDKNNEWPSHFTSQDIHVISIIHDLRMLAEKNEKGLYEMNFNRLAPLFALIGHPCLYWADKDEQVPLVCKQSSPFVRFSSDDTKLCITIHPDNPSFKRVVPIHDSADVLKLCAFSQIQLDLAQIIRRGLQIPLQAKDEIREVCAFLQRELDIVSDIPLEGLDFEVLQAEPTPVLNLDYSNDILTVELVFKPFKQLEQLCLPGSGPCEFLPSAMGSPIRILRNTSEEERQAARLLELCPQLCPETETSPLNWRLTEHNDIFELLLMLHELNDFLIVRWKQNKHPSVSRRLGLSNVHVTISSTEDWFELDGSVNVSDEQTISFRQLLELASQQKGNFITLGNGQILALAKDFKRRLDDFNAIGAFDPEGRFVINRFAVPATQLLFDDAGFADCMRPAEWLRQMEKINAAMALKPKLPDNLSPNVKLRKYQIEGFQWLTRLDAWGAGACLADDMGLGKTLQALAFIASKAEEGPALVVAPTTVCHNWLEQCERFTPTLKPVVFGQGNRAEMLAKAAPSTLMVVSYGLLQSEIESFRKVRWRVVVLDEAQAIKNSQTKRSQAALKLNAQFKIITTGTPLENNLSELWTMFQFITPGLLKSRLHFQNKFAVPIENEKDRVETERLGRIVKPFLLRRRKDQVLKELPPKTEIPYFVELTEKERAFYEAVRLNLIDELQNQPSGSAKQNRIRIIAAITKLRQAACNAKLIEPEADVPSAKLETFVQLVQNLVAANHKALVFSQFVRHLDIVRPILDELGVSYQYLDGSTQRKDRADAVEAFQKGDSNLFLISLKAGGLGLNLTRADFVILLDPWWNPAVEDQASDRAHRIGQTKPVTIYRLIAKQTIEEKIIALHNEKRDLAERILSGADTPGSISAEELLKLITES